MGKDISFSQFLKEGAFREEVVRQTIPTDSDSKPFHIDPEAPASDKESKQFWKQLRHYFRTGDRPSGTNGTLVPALIAPYLRAGNFTNDYPIYISADGERCVSLSAMVNTLYNDCFPNNEARILKANLPRLLKGFRSYLAGKQFAPFTEVWAAVEVTLREVEVHGDKQKTYLDHLDCLAKKLPTDGLVIRFTDEAPFNMLQVQLRHLATQRQAMLEEVRHLIAGLKELLRMEQARKKGKQEGEVPHLDFAADMIEFGKWTQLMPEDGAEGMTEARKLRIEQNIIILQQGVEAWASGNGSFLVTEALYDQFPWPDLFAGSFVKSVGPNEGYATTRQRFEEQMTSYTLFMAARRKATLELKGEYKEDVHDDFFTHFTWHRLTDEELQWFPPVFFVGETSGFLRHNVDRFTTLLAANKPIRLIAIDKRMGNPPDPNIDWEDASHSYRRELSTLTLAFRSTHTFQGAINQPIEVYHGMKRCLQVNAPSIMHWLIPDAHEIRLSEILKLAAAVEGRFFPFLSYDLLAGKRWGSRFNISNNPQPEKDWPEHQFTYIDTSGEEVQTQWPFTYADYKAISKEKLEELWIIPQSQWTSDLIPLADFLAAPNEELVGKIPYIWLVDEDNRLHRAAMPLMWVVSCQERLDNWNFIQELCGVNSFHAQQAKARAMEAWEVEKEKEIEALKAQYEAKIEEVRQTAAGEAMERLSHVLLDLDNLPAAPLTTAPPTPDAAKEQPPDTPNKDEETPDPEPKAPPAEPWLETFRCTSCNECTENYPTAFDYNEDKQAVLADVSTISYEELVMAAEECPAKCIHPGLPDDPDDPAMAPLIKRAEPYN